MKYILGFVLLLFFVSAIISYENSTSDNSNDNDEEVSRLEGCLNEYKNALKDAESKLKSIRFTTMYTDSDYNSLRASIGSIDGEVDNFTGYSISFECE